MNASKEIEKHLRSGKTITALEALGVYNLFRLAPVIHNLRKRGMNITLEMRKARTGKRYGVYAYAN